MIPVNSADAWYEDESDDLEPLLGLSVELANTMNSAQREAEMEAAKQRHPSGKAQAPVPPEPEPVKPDEGAAEHLTHADRCDSCGHAALHRLRLGKGNRELTLCHHHGNRHGAALKAQGWRISGRNATLMTELYGDFKASQLDELFEEDGHA